MYGNQNIVHNGCIQLMSPNTFICIRHFPRIWVPKESQCESLWFFYGSLEMDS